MEDNLTKFNREIFHNLQNFTSELLKANENEIFKLITNFILSRTHDASIIITSLSKHKQSLIYSYYYDKSNLIQKIDELSNLNLTNVQYPLNEIKYIEPNTFQKLKNPISILSNGIISEKKSKEILKKLQIKSVYHFICQNESAIHNTVTIFLSKNLKQNEINLFEYVLNQASIALYRELKFKETREKEFVYKLIFENQTEGFGVVNVDDVFIFSNSAAEKIFDVSPGELLNKCVFDFVDEKNRNIIIEENKKRKSKQSSTYVLTIKTRKGNTKHILITATPYLSENGELLGTLAIFRDISEMYELEQQLKKFQLIIEQSYVSIVITDPDGNIQYVNPKFCQISGYSKEEVIGQNPRILKSGKTSDEEYKQMWETLKSGQNWITEFYNKRKDGTYYWELATISPVFDKKGEIVNFIGIKEDITEKKENLEILKRSELRFRSIWDNSFDGMRLTDENGIIISVNNAFSKLVGKSIEELIGNSYTCIYDTSKNKFDIEKYKVNFSNNNINPYLEREVTLWDGRNIWLELSNSFINIEGDKPLLLSIFRDITERKKYEIELQEAKEKAEIMNKVKTNFLANMSHELRTPMMGILGFTEMLLDATKDKEYHRFVEIIHKSGLRLLDTLNLILDLTKIEAGSIKINFELIDFISFIKEIIPIYELSASRKNLYFNYQILCDSIHLYLDRRMLMEVFNKLLNNAIKFTDKGGVTLRIEVLEEKGNNYLTIKIIDTGIGIPKDKISTIWEPFRQASEGLNRTFEGTGLGLTIAKKYCEKLGGQIFVESEVNKGSTFTIQFPISEKNTLINPEDVLNEEAMRNNRTSDKKLKILIVDDDQVTRELINEFLIEYYNLDFVTNSNDCLDRIQRNNYDLILMDINLGKGLDGLETTKLIRKNPFYANIPIVAITAYAMPEEREEFLSNGFTEYLSKPFIQNDLIKMINRFTKK